MTGLVRASYQSALPGRSHCDPSAIEIACPGALKRRVERGNPWKAARVPQNRWIVGGLYCSVTQIGERGDQAPLDLI